MSDRTLRVGLLVSALLILLTACGTPEPEPTAVAQVPTLVPTLVPTFAPTAVPTATLTPMPLPTATPTPTPSDTPTAVPLTATPTPTPVPPTATPTPLPPTSTPKPKLPTATPKPQDGFQFDITMQRMLSIDENGGTIGNHNIFVQVFKANCDPLDGVVICRVYALQLEPPDPQACGASGETGPGRMHFDVYSGDIIFVGSADEEHRPLSPLTRTLAQEPANMDFQELVDNGCCESIQDCQDRMPKNQLVRFHYSYEVHFKRRW